MYDALVKGLREAHEYAMEYGTNPFRYSAYYAKAADVIEELQKSVNFHKFNSEFWEDKYNSIADEKWIPVTERLPEGADDSGAICENVWLLFDDGGVYPGWMNGRTEKAYYINDYDDIVRKAPISRVKMWQPRPEPPREVE